jgi:two-component system sensor histidine kinase BaeS
MRRSDWGEWHPEEWQAWWAGQGRYQAAPWRKAGRRFMFLGLLFVAMIIGLFLTVAFLIVSLVFDNALTLALITFGAFVVLGVLVRSATRIWAPVRRLIEGAADLASGDYSTRIPDQPAGPAMRPVIGSFNAMAARLQDAEAERRRLMADLGHELRTPLTVIRGEVEALLDGVHDPDPERLRLLIDEVGVMERLLEDLGTLSQTQAGTLALHVDEVDLAELIEDIAAAYDRIASDSDVAVAVDVERPIDIVADPVRVREIITNLVVNALRSMPDGGRLVLEAARTGTGAQVRVIDTGHGIGEDELAGVFDRFRKGAGSSGSGLGLTISRELAEAHGGTLELSSTVDLGTVATLMLPIAP